MDLKRKGKKLLLQYGLSLKIYFISYKNEILEINRQACLLITDAFSEDEISENMTTLNSPKIIFVKYIFIIINRNTKVNTNYE